MEREREREREKVKERERERQRERERKGSLRYKRSVQKFFKQGNPLCGQALGVGMSQVYTLESRHDIRGLALGDLPSFIHWCRSNTV